MNVLALDPGVTTGYVIYHDLTHEISHGQCQPEAIWELLWTFHKQSDTPPVIICESFEYRRHKTHANLTPVEVIGVIKEFVRQYTDIELVFQSPAQAKGFWNDDRLKEHSLYFTGMQHARDAARHWLYWLYFGKGKTIAEIPRNSFKPQ